jgi:hypothetical protein
MTTIQHPDSGKPRAHQSLRKPRGGSRRLRHVGDHEGRCAGRVAAHPSANALEVLFYLYASKGMPAAAQMLGSEITDALHGH